MEEALHDARVARVLDVKYVKVGGWEPDEESKKQKVWWSGDRHLLPYKCTSKVPHSAVRESSQQGVCSAAASLPAGPFLKGTGGQVTL